ncbi:universal stress protein [Streptomyces sp. CWNU-52B]|uniref:universal stress protein n=1 Tax=unclassified Streptomyces TaxID=2593676 RepID=UPI0039C24893
MDTLPVIAAVDGSDDSLRALDWALDAARRREAPLRVVHVREFGPLLRPETLTAVQPEPDTDQVLDLVRDRLKNLAQDAPVTEYLALDGAPAALLPGLGAEAQLMVFGSRGRGGFASLLLGSNGTAAARDAECPVVVVPRPGREVPESELVTPGPRVVVGLHVDSPNDEALAFAFAEAARREARVQVAAVFPWPVQFGELVAAPVVDEDAIESETRALAAGFVAPHAERHPGVGVDLYVLPGDAAGRLVAASQGADLVVVGRHRRRLLAPARMMGSVTQAVLLHAASPVAVIPPAGADGADGSDVTDGVDGWDEVDGTGGARG